MNDLSDYELEQLVLSVPPQLRAYVLRLVEELQRLRNEAGERERVAAAEQEW